MSKHQPLFDRLVLAAIDTLREVVGSVDPDEACVQDALDAVAMIDAMQQCWCNGGLTHLSAEQRVIREEASHSSIKALAQEVFVLLELMVSKDRHPILRQMLEDILKKARATYTKTCPDEATREMKKQ